MPGYVFHLAIANQFLKRHPDYDKEEFIKGTIAPDLLQKKLGKGLTHYADCSKDANVEKYLEKNKLDKGYVSGYALHLIADYIFYHKYLKEWSPKVYDDYDILNAEMIEKYQVVVPEEVKDCVSSKEGELTFISRQWVDTYIEEVSKIEIVDYESKTL